MNNNIKLGFPRFLARNTSLSTLSSFRDARKQFKMFPPVLNTLSEGELVAEMHKYLCANLDSAGNCFACSFHQTKGSSSLSTEAERK